MFYYLLTTLSLQIFFFLITVSLFSSTVSLGIIPLVLDTTAGMAFLVFRMFTKPFPLEISKLQTLSPLWIGKEYSLYICFLLIPQNVSCQLPHLISSLATLHFHSVHIEPLRVLFLIEFHPSHFVQIREFPKANLSLHW